jgi:hypothetical protein
MGGCAFKALAVRPSISWRPLNYSAPNRAGPTKPFFGADENRPETKMRSNRCDQTMESVIWDITISLIHHQSCRNYRAAARKGLWA